MKYRLILGVWMVATTTLFAQHRQKNFHNHSSHQTDWMKKELALDDTQYATVKGINKKYADEHGVIRRDTIMSREEKAESLKTLRTKRQKEIGAVLTPEQNSKWQTIRKERVEKRKTQQQTRRGDYLKKELSLTDEQEQKIESARKESRDKLIQLRENNKLSREEKQNEMKKIRDAHESSLKVILDEQQFKKWQDIKSKQGAKHKPRRKR